MEEQNIKTLPGYDAVTLDNEFGKLHRADSKKKPSCLRRRRGAKPFGSLVRPQARKLKAISDVWLKNAPSDRKGVVGQKIQPNLRTQIELRLETRKSSQAGHESGRAAYKDSSPRPGQRSVGKSGLPKKYRRSSKSVRDA